MTRYRYPALLGDDTVLDEVDPEAVSADLLRALIRSAGFVIVRMPGDHLSLETPDSLTPVEDGPAGRTGP
jgi:hypothetical protein